MKKDVETRWNTATAKTFTELLIKLGRSGNGHLIESSPFGTPNPSTGLDLQRLPLPARTEIRRITLKDADLSGAIFKKVRVENSAFSGVRFEKTVFQEASDHGNRYDECQFIETNFRRAAIGYRGSSFKRCQFVRADFRDAVFVRPEFNGCSFQDCNLDGVDLNGSSFENCDFRGELREVWFRGGFALSSDEEQYGRPRPNKMTNVSFESANIVDVTFSDRCDLSTVVVPKEGNYRLFNRWEERLTVLMNTLSSWPSSWQEAGTLFCKSHLIHAQNQDWYILGLDELMDEFGAGVGGSIWKALNSD